MMLGPKLPTNRKNSEQMALEELVGDIVSNVGELREEYISDFKKFIAQTPLNRLNFNATIKKVPLFVLLMEESEINSMTEQLLLSLFRQVPLAKLNWNVELRRSFPRNTIYTPLLVLMRSAIARQTWAQETLIEVLQCFSINELLLNTTESQGEYRDQSILGMLLCAGDHEQKWALVALEVLAQKKEIDTNLDARTMAALGLILYSLFEDSSWTLDALKIVSESKLRTYYDWTILARNKEVIIPSVADLLAKLALLGYPHFLLKLLLSEKRKSHDFNYTIFDEWAVDHLCDSPKTRGMACLLVIIDIINGKEARGKGSFIEPIMTLIQESADRTFRSYLVPDKEVHRAQLYKSFDRALTQYLPSMLERDKVALLCELADSFLQKKYGTPKVADAVPAKEPIPKSPQLRAEDLAVQFGYNLHVQPPQTLLMAFQHFSLSDDDDELPLKPPVVVASKPSYQ